MSSHRFEFWLGRAGSGKTHACIQAIAAMAHDQPRGRPLLLLVPEQMSAQADYRLIAQSGLLGSTRARVFSFVSLKQEIFRSEGGLPRGVIDEEMRVLLLRQLIRRRKADLKILGDCADLPGLAEAVSQTLVELRHYGWTRLDLRSKLAGAEAIAEYSTVLQWKLHDLHLLWDEYERELEKRGLTEELSLDEIAAERLKSLSDFGGAKLWIDGFGSFTSQERLLLDALLTHVDSACFSLCLDPRDPKFQSRKSLSLREGDAYPPKLLRTGHERLFDGVEQTYRSQRERMIEAGWQVVDVEFPKANQTTRFSESNVLGHLESRVVTGLWSETCPDATWSAESSGQSCDLSAWPPGPLELLEAEDPRSEIEAVARRIAAMCREQDAPHCPWHGLRWSEVTVITRDLEVYGPLVREIFPRFGIPFFIDQKRDISGHSLARLLISALDIAAHDFSAGSVVDYLRSGLTPVENPDLINAIENLAAERRFTPRDWLNVARWMPPPNGRRHPEKEALAQRLFDAWKPALLPLLSLDTSLENGMNPANALWGFLESIRAAEILQTWVDQARANGDEENALLHEGAWKKAVEMLERLATVGITPAGNRGGIDRQELLEVVETGLSTIKAGLAPPTLDQVLVGSVDRTRTPEVKAALVVGMVEGEFPRFFDEDPMFGDQERRELASEGRELGPDSKSKYDQERFFAYIALTRASRYLFVSRPIAGGAKKVAGPSSYFRAVREAFPQAPADPAPGPLLGEELARNVARAYHGACQGEDPMPLDAALRSEHPLSHAGLENPENTRVRSRMQTTLAALGDPRAVQLDPELAREFWNEDRLLSVTSLEKYSQCPFQFFVSRMLRLEHPREPIPGPQELGSLRHAVLEALFRELGRGAAVHWGSVDLDEASRIIDEAVNRAMKGHLLEKFGGDTLAETLIGIARQEMKYFARALQTMGRRTNFAQARAEFRFGRDDEMRIELQAGGDFSFVLHGSIDRLDEDRGPDGAQPPKLVIYDYKSSKKSIDWARMMEGADLQLPAYALAIQSHFSNRRDLYPAGAEVGGFFYWPLSIGIASAEGEDETWADPGSEQWFENHKLDGILDENIARRLDHAAGAGESALAFKFKWTVKDRLSEGAGNHLPAETFDALIVRTRRLMEQRAREIAAGKIAVLPLKKGKESSCNHCDFGAVCRVDLMGEDACKVILPLRLKEVRAILEGGEGKERGARSGKE